MAEIFKASATLAPLDLFLLVDGSLFLTVFPVVLLRFCGETRGEGPIRGMSSASSTSEDETEDGGGRGAESSSRRRGTSSSSTRRRANGVWPEPFLESLAVRVATDAARSGGRLAAGYALANIFQVRTLDP